MGFEKLPSEAPDNVDEDTPPHSDADTTEDEVEDTDMDSAPPQSKSVKPEFSKSQGEKVSPPRQSEHLNMPPSKVVPSPEKNSPPKSPAVLAPPAPLESPLNNADGSETSDDEL